MHTPLLVAPSSGSTARSLVCKLAKPLKAKEWNNWAGLCEKGPYGCGRGFEISRDKVWSITMMMQYDTDNLIACCAMMTHCSNLWSASFESHCAEVSCGFWFIEIGSCLATYVCFKCWLLLSSSQILCQSWLYENSHNSTKEQDFYKRFSTM